MTSLIILNCIYFKQDWLQEFDLDTYEKPFSGLSKKTNVKYLRKNYNFFFYEEDDLDIVEIPFKYSSICCYLFVPTYKNTVNNIFENFNYNYNKINNVKSYSDVDIITLIPPFKIESTFNLSENTKQSGLTNIFDLNKDWNIIDFNKLDPLAVMAVEKIKQKTYFDFTKEGVEAAASTIITACVSGCSILPFKPRRIKVILANKPFMFVLADSTKKEYPLFVGVVNDI